MYAGGHTAAQYSRGNSAILDRKGRLDVLSDVRGLQDSAEG